MIIPSKHTGHTRDGVRRVFDSGGSGPSETTQKIDVPDWAKPYAQEALAKAAALTQTPYQAYTGERVAGFTPLQQQAFQAAGQQGIAGQIGQATGIAGQAATGALGAGAGFSPYQTGQFGVQAASYMSPYMQNVVDIQQREAQRQADIAGTQRAAAATKAGAFGGGRQAIVEAEAARNLALQKGDIQAQGLQAAYDQAQAQFNREQQLAEQSRQYGAGLGLQGFQTALQGAGALGTLGGQQFAQQMDITQQQQALGAQQQELAQQGLTAAYQDFLAQQKAPYQQLEFLNNMVRGLGSTTSIYSPQPSMTSQLLGAGTALAGFAAAEGGEVPGYAEGGITALLGDEQLAQRQQMPTISTLARLAAEKEAAERAQLRQGLMAAQQAQAPAPQGTVADEVAAGLMAADVPDNMFADGGIVAFQSGGYTPFALPELERDPRIAGLVAGRGATDAEEEMRLIPAFWQALREGKTVEQIRAERAKGIPAVLPVPPVNQAAPSAADEVTRLASRFPAPAKPKAGLETIAPPTGAGGAKIAPPTEAGAAKPPVTTGATRPTGIAAAAKGIPTAEELMAQAQKLAGPDRSAEAQELLDSATQKQVDAVRRAEEEQAAQEKALGPVGAEREKRIAAKEERLAAEEKKNFKNTLIEAGLAIMAGQSPNALTNLAQGAAAGLKGYQSRLAKYEAARDKLDEDRITLDELRRESALASGARKRQVDQEIAKLESAALRERANMISAAYDTNRKTALDVVKTAEQMRVDVQLKREQIASNERMPGLYARASAGKAGAGAGSKWTDLTAQQKAALRDKAARAWDSLDIFDKNRYLKAGGTQDQWIDARAQYLFEGATPVQSQATSAATSGFGKVIREK